MNYFKIFISLSKKIAKFSNLILKKQKGNHLLKRNL